MQHLNDFLSSSIMNIAGIAGRFYLGNRRGQSFMIKMIPALRRGSKLREQFEQKGIHVPPFLIASIAASCNLRCAGCYARANGSCGDNVRQEEMSSADWRRVFSEASGMGVSFILLAGGEPLLRRDVIETAAQFENIIFPIFTNGTVLDDQYYDLFDKHRNLIPVISIEGDETKTDTRRGKGVSDKILQTVNVLKERGILYGVSITVTNENMTEVTSPELIGRIRNNGCGLVFFVEYVPVEEETEHLALSEEDMHVLQNKISSLRSGKTNKGMILLSFPGDEEMMGGCLAAGRGFFHINANGGAEPCPFSPYSEMNLKEQALAEVLQSEFFKKVREIGAGEDAPKNGGCTLFKYRDKVADEIKA